MQICFLASLVVRENLTLQVAVNPHNTVFDTKRLIGRKFNDDTVQSDVKLWPFTVEAGAANKPMIRVDFKFETKVGLVKKDATHNPATSRCTGVQSVRIVVYRVREGREKQRSTLIHSPNPRAARSHIPSLQSLGRGSSSKLQSGTYRLLAHWATVGYFGDTLSKPRSTGL